MRRAGRLQRRAELALVVQRREHEQLAGDELVAALLRELVGEVEQAGQIVAETLMLPSCPLTFGSRSSTSADALCAAPAR